MNSADGLGGARGFSGAVRIERDVADGVLAAVVASGLSNCRARFRFGFPDDLPRSRRGAARGRLASQLIEPALEEASVVDPCTSLSSTGRVRQAEVVCHDARKVEVRLVSVADPPRDAARPVIGFPLLLPVRLYRGSGGAW